MIAVAMISGCSPTPALDGMKTSTESISGECLRVSVGAITGLQWGLDDRNGLGLSVDGASSVSVDDVWFVAARIDGPGVGADTISVWESSVDPATVGDGAGYLSIDGIAAEFSSYVQSLNHSVTSDGVDQVRGCLAGG